VGRQAITTTCSGPQLAIVRFYTLKRMSHLKIVNASQDNIHIFKDLKS